MQNSDEVNIKKRKREDDEIEAWVRSLEVIKEDWQKLLPEEERKSYEKELLDENFVPPELMFDPENATASE